MLSYTYSIETAQYNVSVSLSIVVSAPVRSKVCLEDVLERLISEEITGALALAWYDGMPCHGRHGATHLAIMTSPVCSYRDHGLFIIASYALKTAHCRVPHPRPASRAGVQMNLIVGSRTCSQIVSRRDHVWRTSRRLARPTRTHTITTPPPPKIKIMYYCVVGRGTRSRRGVLPAHRRLHRRCPRKCAAGDRRWVAASSGRRVPRPSLRLNRYA